MAKIKYSALVSDMRNSLNGSTLSKNRYGSYMRNKVTPVNPQTSFQQRARMILGNLSSSFRELSREQIVAWNNASRNFPFTDIFGDVRHLTGQTLFVKLNANLEKIGLPRVSTPPLPVGFPEFAVLSVSMDMTSSALTSASIEIDPSTIPSGYTLAIYATPSVSKSISFVKNQFRFIGVGVAVGGSVDFTDEYIERFGQPTVDEVVHIRVALISNDTGQQGVPTGESAVVTVAP